MRTQPILLALLASSLAIVIPIAEAGERPWAPRLVLASSSNAGAVVAWAPGEVVADSYNVYGVDHGALVLLAASVAPAFDVRTSEPYPAYAVSGVKGGVESEPVGAIVTPCVFVNWDPPDVFVREDCSDGQL